MTAAPDEVGGSPRGRRGWRRAAGRLLGLLLVADGLVGAAGVLTVVPAELTIRGAGFALLLAAQVVESGLAAMAGGLLMAERRPGRVLARWALLASATLTTLDLGVGLAPSNLDPTFRWPVVVLAWLWAIGGMLCLRFTRADL